MNRQGPPEDALVELTPEELARLWRLPEEEGFVLSGSPVRVPAAKVREWETQLGPLDKTLADCSLVTGIKVKTLHGWRKRGALRVRALSCRSDGLRVSPAELVRVLRELAAAQNSSTERIETVAQSQRRGSQARIRAMIACGWTGDDVSSRPTSRRKNRTQRATS